jgi:hypothetical protein
LIVRHTKSKISARSACVKVCVVCPACTFIVAEGGRLDVHDDEASAMHAIASRQVARRHLPDTVKLSLICTSGLT